MKARAVPTRPTGNGGHGAQERAFAHPTRRGRSTGGDFAHAFGLRARFAQVYEIRAPNFS